MNCPVISLCSPTGPWKEFLHVTPITSTEKFQALFRFDVEDAAIANQPCNATTSFFLAAPSVPSVLRREEGAGGRAGGNPEHPPWGALLGLSKGVPPLPQSNTQSPAPQLPNALSQPPPPPPPGGAFIFPLNNTR